MNKTIVTLFILLLSNTITGQEKIDMNLSIWGFQFKQGDEKLKPKDLDKITEKNIEANLLIKKARRQNTITTILDVTGGALIGIPLGQSIFNEADPNWTLAYIGGGLVGISIPFSISSANNFIKGVDTYNASLNKMSYSNYSPELKVLANGNGIGLSISF